MIRWGLIGASDIAETRMLPAINRLSDSKVVAVFSGNPMRGRAYAQRNGIATVFDSLQELLDSSLIDAVYVSTINNLHRDQVLSSAAAGKHVLCEKPLAMTIDDAVAMERGCEAAGVVFGTNHHLRNAATHWTLRQIIQSGKIGTPLAARVFHAVYLPERLQGWRLSSAEAGGGVVLDITVHDADTLRFDLHDDPVEVTAMTASQGMASNGLPDSVMGVIRFRSGLLAQFHDAFTVAHTRTALEVHGDEGSIRLSEAMTQELDGDLVLQQGDRMETVDIGPREDLYVRSVRAFNAAIRGEGQPAATGRDGIWSLAVALAAMASAETGSVVPVNVPAPGSI